ncbi:uncharacterized protein IL334_000839 [Kwoniella shivajii]|uniref:RanBP2-type domain-containing protein n=1 Tax=Kwoniella shivajii TaxID=564305 RepID=A0ABZ1CQV2_9TREE|nr:hypothetical protein IL334_000839 [Kwoniella shivajii]
MNCSYNGGIPRALNGKGKKVEDIQDLVHSLSLSGPRDTETDDDPSRRQFSLYHSKETFNPFGDAKEETRSISSFFHQLYPINTNLDHNGIPWRRNHRARHSSSSYDSKEEKDDKPLPIGTERKLAILERSSSNQTSNRIETTASSSRIAQPQAHSSWAQAGMALSSHIDGEGTFRDRGHKRETSMDGGEGKWNRHNPLTSPAGTRRNDIDYNRPTHLGMTEFLPFNLESASQNLRSRNASSPNATAGPSNHSTQTVGEYSFSDLVLTPGFGGYASTPMTDKHRRMMSLNSPHPVSDHQIHSSTTFEGSACRPPTRNAQEILEQNLVNQGKRRSSVPASSLNQRMNRGPVVPVPDPRNSDERTSLSQQFSIGNATFGPDYGQMRYGSPDHTYQNFSSATHRDIGLESARTSLEDRSTLSTTQFSNTGFLPAHWAPGLDLIPRNPSPFAPGDWRCPQPWCDYHNFQRNSECRACGHSRPWEVQPQAPTIISPPLGSFGDWRCDCGYINWRRRSMCKNCHPEHHLNQDRPAISLPRQPRGINNLALTTNAIGSSFHQNNDQHHRVSQSNLISPMNGRHALSAYGEEGYQGSGLSEWRARF